MAGIPATPAVAFFCGEGLAVVGFDVAPLSFAVPEVVSLEQGIQIFEIVDGGVMVAEVGVADFFEGVGRTGEEIFGLQFIY